METLNPVQRGIVGLFRTYFEQHRRLPMLTYSEIMNSGIATPHEIATALHDMCERQLLCCAGSVQWNEESTFFLIGQAAEWARKPPAS